MKIIGPAPGKAPWGIQRLHHPDGKVRFKTGDYVGTRYGRYPGEPVVHDGMRVEECANVVVEAAFSLDGKRLVDRDTGHPYEVSQSTLYDLVEAMVEGRVRVEGDCVWGRFSFKRFGGKVWLAPTPPDRMARRARPVEAGDAEDLSDFVRGLAKAGG